MAKTVSKVLGILSVLIASVFFFTGARINPYHDLLHIVWGVIAIGFGFFGSVSQARVFCIASGFFYVALAAAAFILTHLLMIRSWQMGSEHFNIGDQPFHVLLGAGLLTSGFFTKRKA
jgi:Domain of unknown function (DUF4383)